MKIINGIETTIGPDIDDSNIDGGTIDNCIIGGSTPAAGSFTQMSGTINTEVLSSAKTLIVTDYIGQWLDPNGTDRDITLPAEALSTNLMFIILNTANGAGENILIKDDSPATIITLGPGMTGIFSCDGTSWKCNSNVGVFYDSVGDFIGIGTTDPETPIHILGNVFPVGKFERTSTSTNETRGVLGLKHTTTEGMADGFGPSLSFYIEDNADVENAIASVAAIRNGSDNTGAIVLKPYLNGSAVVVLEANAKHITNRVGRRIHKTDAGAANYNPSVETSDHVITVDTTAAARTVTISTEDRDSGTSDNPRVFIIKDIAGNAGTNNITVSLETSGNIDGAANHVINGNYNSITLIIDGTNGYII